MKRIGNLYPQITAIENLYIAFRKAVKGKQGRDDVILFRKSFDENIQNIRKQLITEEPDIGHYHFFTVRDPKLRTICAASFPERILHHAIMNICEPYFDACAIHDSYACRKGKGNRKALRRAQKFSGRYSWYLKLDISKYFDSIRHETALRLLEKRFRDKSLLNLFEKILNSFHYRSGQGLPIGNLISQHIANYYLCPFDHWVKEERRINGYLRYMDDFVLFAESKDRLKAELKEIKRYLEENLQLKLKKDIQINRSKRGLPFLGFRIFPSHIRLQQRSRKRFIEKLKEYEGCYLNGVWTEEELVRHVEPLIDFTRAGDTVSFRRSLIKDWGRFPERLEPRQSWRQMEQFCQELPVGESEQQFAGQPEQQPGLPAGSFPSSTDRRMPVC